jgi:hypothetical protein
VQFRSKIFAFHNLAPLCASGGGCRADVSSGRVIEVWIWAGAANTSAPGLTP